MHLDTHYMLMLFPYFLHINSHYVFIYFGSIKVLLVDAKCRDTFSSQFKTLDEAEEFFDTDYFEGQQLADFSSISSTPVKESSNTQGNVSDCLSPLFYQSPSPVRDEDIAKWKIFKMLVLGTLFIFWCKVLAN